MEGHTAWVNPVCSVVVGGQALLASAGGDRTVRIWNPATGTCRLIVPVHYEGLALAWLPGDLLVVGLSGLLALRIPG